MSHPRKRRNPTTPESSLLSAEHKPASENNKSVKQEFLSNQEPAPNHTIGQLGISAVWWFTAIGVLALVLRVMSLAQTAAIPSTVYLLGDAATYYAWAEKIAAGAWYGEETFYQAPLYPYVLAILMKFFGVAAPGIRMTQALLGCVSCILIAATTRTLFDLRSAIVAGVMMATYAPAIYYDGIIQKSSLASFLLCGLLWASLMIQNRVVHGSKLVIALSAVAGVLLGLLVLTRENALLWIPLFPAWLIWIASPLRWRSRLVLAGVFVLGLASVLFPVAARNASLGGEWSPTTFQAGPNFYIGNHAGASGIYEPLVPGHETPLYERSDAHRLADQDSGRELSSREVSRFWFAKTWDEIRNDPSAWIGLLCRKSAMVLNHFEVPDVESLFIHQQYSVVLRVLSFWQFGTLLPMAAIGIVLTRKRWKELTLLYVLIAIMVIAIVGFFILGRYRFPLVPLLMPFAAVGATQLIEQIRQRRWNDLAIPIVIALIVAIAGYLPMHAKNELNAAALMNVGVAAGSQGDLSNAIYLLDLSNQMDVTNAETHFNLGYAYMQAEQLERAIKHFVKAVEIKPNLKAANFQLARCLEQYGRPEDAVVFYTQVLRIDPNESIALEAIERLSAERQAP